MMPNDMQMFQAVIITLSDGTRAMFTGPAVCELGDKRGIAKVAFCEPKPLAEFEAIMADYLLKFDPPKYAEEEDHGAPSPTT